MISPSSTPFSHQYAITTIWPCMEISIHTLCHELTLRPHRKYLSNPFFFMFLDCTSYQDVPRCYTLNPVGVRSRSRSGVCVESDLASAYVLHPYITICPNISECRSLGQRWTRTRDSGEIRYLNWGISPQLVGLKYNVEY
jgi:hypothetical protein